MNFIEAFITVWNYLLGQLVNFPDKSSIHKCYRKLYSHSLQMFKKIKMLQKQTF